MATSLSLEANIAGVHHERLSPRHKNLEIESLEQQHRSSMAVPMNHYGAATKYNMFDACQNTPQRKCVQALKTKHNTYSDFVASTEFMDFFLAAFENRYVEGIIKTEALIERDKLISCGHGTPRRLYTKPSASEFEDSISELPTFVQDALRMTLAKVRRHSEEAIVIKAVDELLRMHLCTRNNQKQYAASNGRSLGHCSNLVCFTSNSRFFTSSTNNASENMLTNVEFSMNEWTQWSVADASFDIEFAVQHYTNCEGGLTHTYPPFAYFAIVILSDILRLRRMSQLHDINTKWPNDIWI